MFTHLTEEPRLNVKGKFHIRADAGTYVTMRDKRMLPGAFFERFLPLNEAFSRKMVKVNS